MDYGQTSLDVLALYHTGRLLATESIHSDLVGSHPIMDLKRPSLVFRICESVSLVVGPNIVALDLDRSDVNLVSSATRLVAKDVGFAGQVLDKCFRISIAAKTKDVSERFEKSERLLEWYASVLRQRNVAPKAKLASLPAWCDIAAAQLMALHPRLALVPSRAVIYKRLEWQTKKGSVYIELRADDETVDFAFQNARGIFDVMKWLYKEGGFEGLYDHLNKKVRVHDKYHNDHPTVILPMRANGSVLLGQMPDADIAKLAVNAVKVFLGANGGMVENILHTM